MKRSVSRLKNDIMAVLASAKELDDAINTVLAMIGTYFQVDRAYIFENIDNDKACRNTFEWCNDGVAPQIDNLQYLDYQRDIGQGYLDSYDADGLFFCPDVKQQPEQQRAILEPQGIFSMLHSAIRERGQFKGYIGFDNCQEQLGGWETDPDAVDTLIFASRLMSLFLLEYRNKAALQAALDEALRTSQILNHVAGTDYDYIMAVDIAADTYQIFSNEQDPSMASVAPQGCYSEAIRAYAEAYVLPEDRPIAIDQMGVSFLVRALQSQPVLVTQARMPMPDGTLRYKQAKFSYLTADRRKLLITRTDITALVASAEKEKLLLQKELDEKSKREQTLLAGIPGGAAIYRLKKDGRFYTDSVTDGVARMFGWDDTDEFMRYYQHDAAINVAPEDLPILQASVQRSLATHCPVYGIYHNHVKGGADILQRLDATIIDRELVEDDIAVWYATHSLINDETQTILKEQKRYRGLVQALDIALFEWVKDGEYYCSDNFLNYAISENAAEDIISGRIGAEVLHPDDAENAAQFVARCKEHAARNACILRLKMKDGSFRWTEMLAFNEYDAEKNPRRAIGVFRDVDKERIEQNERLTLALNEARKANQAKNDFFARMSHDIRTPMNAIIGLTALSMDEPDLSPQMRENLTNMRGSGEFLLGLVNDILDMSKIEAGSVKLKLAPYAYTDFLAKLKAMFEPQCRAKSIRFAFEEVTVSTCVWADKLRMDQIFFNILSNAVKFTPEGGTISYHTENVQVTEDTISSDYIIEDTGIGMSPAFLERVFTPFEQEDTRYSSNLKGSGLGLSIAKSLTELMGGAISVESREGEGTRVTVHLGFALCKAEAAAQAIPAVPKPESDDILAGKRVLLVEDHPLNAKIAQRLLEKKGMVVTHAANGQVAVDDFSTSPPSFFDAVMMDIRMPVMDGLEAAAAIRALDRPDASTVPIIAMSANAYDEDVQKSLHSGMNGHLAKPVEPTLLYETLTRFLSR